MCGIAGFYGFEDKQLLQNMTKLLGHRGPDQFGYYTDELVSLGHRRLSIIDLSEAGKQPMCNEDNSIWVVFNGEIYNFKKLREELEEAGHTFKSETDTEVIVHAYEEYGEDCVEKFNGCFAFAIYDSPKKKLFLARDRMGIKPLYYTQVGNHFYFASEIKSMLNSQEVPRKVNLTALNYYLSFYANPQAETMFAGIYKLLPGHTLTLQHGQIHLKKYWNLEMKPLQASESHVKDDLHDLLHNSTYKRLMSDVPLGVYLSGGVDSGSVVALMNTITDNVKTFSVGFDDERSELRRARSLAEHFNTDHQEVMVGLDSIKHLSKIVWHQDEPMGDPTSIPTYLLSQEAKKKVTVVLTGEGADEQFAGYEQEKFLMMHQNYIRRFPLWMRKAGSWPVKTIPAQAWNVLFDYMGQLGEEGKRRLVEFITSNDYATQLLSMVSLFTDAEKRQMAVSKLLDEITHNPVGKTIHKQYFSNVQHNLLNQALLFENQVLLTENLLMKVDKNTMAHGIEARVPFLDHRIVEFAAKLPQQLKLKGMKDKYILRETVKPLLPAQRHAQKKQRFFVPVDHWLKNQLKPLSHDLLSRTRIEKQGYFDHHYIQKMFDGYDRSPLFYGRQLWTLLNFQMWHKMFIEEEKVIF